MTTINQLSTIDTLQGADLVPVYSSSNGDARKASMTTVKNFVSDALQTQIEQIQSEIDALESNIGAGDASLVGYQAAGVGAILSNVGAKLRESVSVKDFGAVGNGVNDDTAAIQAAVDSLKPYSEFATDGALIYFPPGRYKVSSAIDLEGCHGLNIVGAGQQATEVFTTGINQVFKSINSSVSPVNKLSIGKMTVRGGGKSNSNAHGIDFQWTNFCSLFDLVFFGCRHCINVKHNWQTSVINVTGHGSGSDQSYIGMYLAESTLANIDNAIQAVNVYFQGLEMYGFRIINGQGSKFTNCEAGGSPMVNAWYIGDPSSGTVTSRWVHFSNCLGDSTSSACWLFRKGACTELSEMHLSNCWAGNGEYGFYLDGARNLALSGCLAIGNTKSGVCTLNAVQNTFNGMQLRGNNEYASAADGDFLLQSSNFNIINGCSCNSNAAGKSVFETGTSNDNNISGCNLFQGVTIVGANSKISRNAGAPTETVGSAVVLSANTSVTVTHGSVITPSINQIRVTPRDNMGSATKFWVSNVNSSTFDINTNVTPGANITFAWAVSAIN